MIKTRSYLFNSELKIWTTPSQNDIVYSDGDSVENRLLAVLQESIDISSASVELRSHIIDWPSEYHFSSIRHNLLRPFTFGQSNHILELGCGCGAITRYLGECGATVVAVEGSRRRATIAAERCRDLRNVSVYCDNIAEFELPERFNVVTLIGVLEYAGLFITGDDPVGECLRIAHSFLADDGILIVAIENQLGLKYFNGCREDHTGILYFGIHGLYESSSLVTFGKRELESRLCAAGFGNTNFFYPFPDYKLPNLILTDEGITHAGFRPADLLSRNASRDYTGSTRRVFHENMAWLPITRNGLLPELANSFLVLARKSMTSNTPVNWLARLYNTERLPDFATETVFQSKGDTIIVEKRLLFHQTPQHNLIKGLHLYHHPSSHAPYVFGRLYAAELHPILARGGDVADLAKWARPWIERLISEATQGPNGKMLSGTWLDAIPSNFVRDISGNLVLIDEEWQIEEPIPFAWVLTRGFIYTLTTCPASPSLSGLSFKDAINQVLVLLGHPPFTDADLKATAVLEDALQKTVNGQPHEIGFAELIERHINSCRLPLTISEENSNLHREITLLHKEIAMLHGEIARVKSTISWKITKPLRFFAFLWRWITILCCKRNTNTGKHLC